MFNFDHMIMFIMTAIPHTNDDRITTFGFTHIHEHDQII